MVAVAAGLLCAPPITAQSVLWGAVSGTVTTSIGLPVRGAVVLLTSLDGAVAQEARTDFAGNFSFALVVPASYEVRAEAPGYRPLVVRTVSVTGGERSNLSLRLTQAAPPVLTIDTMRIGGGTSRWRGNGQTLGADELDRLPYRVGDLASVVALAPSTDWARGIGGLPGSMSTLVVDGVPTFRAPHPFALSERLDDDLFPRSALSEVATHQGAPDAEWTGSAAGYYTATTRSSTTEGGIEAEGWWSGGPLWSSSELDIDRPSLTSFRGAARTGFVSGGSKILVGGEALREETPLAPRVDSNLAASLSGLDSDLVAALQAPVVETVSRYSALARADVERNATSRFFVRGSVAYAERDFDGPGPIALAGDASPPEESVDFSLAGGVIAEYRPGLAFEIRTGTSGSNRKFDASAGGMASAVLTGSGTILGVPAGAEGESTRVDLTFAPIVHYELGGGDLKAGASGRLSRHTMSYGSPGEFMYSDGAAIVAGRGFGRSYSIPEASFTTGEWGLFAQYDIDVDPRLHVSLGGRYDNERIPTSDAALNTAWLLASGLRNDSTSTSLHQLSARGSFVWDPTGTGSTRVSGALSMDHGDVDTRAIAQLLAEDVDATSTVVAGTGLVWPGGTLPGSATTASTLTMLGPDTRAPRSTNVTVGIVRELLGGWSLYVQGAYRRTDFLMRRRNLNLPVQPKAVDAYGRDVFGTLVQDGSLVTATGSDARRFAAFNEVWALDPDGWSEYRAGTAALEYAGARASLYAAYTWSETKDNWIGVSSASREAELPPHLPASGDWSEGTSDFDRPHQVSVAATASWSLATLSALYHFRSGRPFTPGYRRGVDANGDGSSSNDVAYVDAAAVAPVLDAWPCLEGQTDGFAARNSCRGPSEHSLAARLSLEVGRIGSHGASLVFEGFNLIESGGGVIDDALLLVDPSGSITTSPDGSTVTIPVSVNPDFGRVLYPSSRGRLLRVGFSIR